MSYYNQGPPPPPHPGYPPQQGGYPPNQGQGYQQGYPPGPPQGGWNQGPPGNYGPPQGGSPYPPQGPGGPYGAPPPGPYGYQGGPPPQGPYGGGPPPHQGGNYGPPPNQYVGGGYGGGGPGRPAPPSPGYNPSQQPNIDMSRAADDLRAAMKGLGTDENKLIRTLAPLDPLQIASVKAAFHARHHRDLMKDVHSETSGYFREALEAIIRGPLEQDCHVLHESIKGLGTKESAMNEVLLGRSNADLNAIKQFYHQKYRHTVEADVKGDLSLKTERLFDMVLSARRNEESAPVIPQQIDADVEQLYQNTEGRGGTDQVVVCSILSSRSDGQIRAISQAYRQRFHRSLDDIIKKNFSGHMEDALLYMLRSAEDQAKHDADLLEDAMKGIGTKDKALVRRVVRVHWDRARLQQCKAAYRHFYKQDLAARIRGETSGDYEKILLIFEV